MLIPHPHQQQAPLGTIHCHLPNDLVEGLTVELLPDGADPCAFGLPFLEHEVEPLGELDDVLAGGGLVGDVLYVEFVVVVVPVFGGEDGIDDVWMGAVLPYILGGEGLGSWLVYLSWW